MQLLDKRNEERDHIADVIRQEFVDKIVSTEEENKRLKNEIAELKARHRVDLERAKADAEIVLKAKAEEMEEVHKRSVTLNVNLCWTVIKPVCHVVYLGTCSRHCYIRGCEIGSVPE